MELDLHLESIVSVTSDTRANAFIDYPLAINLEFEWRKGGIRLI